MRTEAGVLMTPKTFAMLPDSTFTTVAGDFNRDGIVDLMSVGFTQGTLVLGR